MTGNSSGAAIAYLSSAHVAAARGEYQEARRLIEKFRSYPTPGRPAYQPGDVELLEASIALEEKSLSDQILNQGEALVKSMGNLSAEKEFYILRSRFQLEQGDSGFGLVYADKAIEIIRRTGERAALPFSLRALSLTLMGRDEESREALGKANNNIYSARACMELGLTDAAKVCLMKAYKTVWDDGPPYCYKWELDRCREMLAELGIPEPELPPFDPLRAEKLPYEDEIRAVTMTRPT